MSLLHINYFSKPLDKHTFMYVVIPDGEGPFQAVYLLHGLIGDYTSYQRRSTVEMYADQLGLLLVMPDSGRCNFTDMRCRTGAYEQHVLYTTEFIDRTFHTDTTSHGRGIGGLSAAGYSAMRIGLRHPEIFGSVGVHSSGLDMAARLAREDWPELRETFGDALLPDEDCFLLAAQPGPKPAIYFDCGLDDGQLAVNRRFHAHLEQHHIEHRYCEYPGAHTWEYWDKHLITALQFHRDCRLKHVGVV